MAELNTSQINERLGGVKVTGELIAELGIAPTRREKRAMYWDESLFPTICVAVCGYVASRPHAADVDLQKTTPAADDLFGE
jgi:hypothetical protein